MHAINSWPCVVCFAPPLLKAELPPPYTAIASPDASGVPVINCRVCQSLINLDGKLHQHVVKCTVCNEATVSGGRRWGRSPRSKWLLVLTSQSRSSWVKTFSHLLFFYDQFTFRLFRALPDVDADICHIGQSGDECSVWLECVACVSAWVTEGFDRAVSGDSRENEWLSSQTLGWEMPFPPADICGAYASREPYDTLWLSIQNECLAFSCCILFQLRFTRRRSKAGAMCTRHPVINFST